ncbi:MAG: methyltransferase domain-containing protein [Minicystis sp.]
MRLRHFESLRPCCPICRRDRGESQPLALATVIRREADTILEGVLLCPSAACQREYPILDGIPIIVAGLRTYLADNLFQAMMRDDFSETIESILGDCSGPASFFDGVRHQLSCYARDHYGLHDPTEPATEPRPGAAARVLDRGLDLASRWPEGPIVDLGCSVGGTTFALAERTGRLVLGVDLNLAMLRLAASTLVRGEVRYPRKRTGVVYDQRRFPVHFAQRENVDFWACDVAALPFAEGAFALASILNLVDCVHDPRGMLVEAARVLAPGAAAVICSPYDWSAAATPMETWLGGHSQRGAAHGDGAAVLRALLTQSGHPAAIPGLRLEAEIEEVPWHVRLHDRSTVGYGVHVVAARKDGGRE